MIRGNSSHDARPTAQSRELAKQVRTFFVFEMSTGQMVEDVRLAIEGRIPVGFYGRMGGIIPSPEEVAYSQRLVTAYRSIRL